MSTTGSSSHRSRWALFFDWLVRVNSQVTRWAATMSWWRLILLFLLLTIAGAWIGDLLHLKHNTVRVVRSGGEQVITIGGEHGIRIVQGPHAKDAVPAMPGGPAGVAAPGAPKPPAAAGTDPQDALDAAADAAAAAKGADAEDSVISRRVVTFRGILGDLGGVVLVVLFAYLAAAKIVVKKVAQADAKVRTALDAAERETMERQLVEARLEVLQAQVEPHFLFNTLSAVDYLIETDPPRASRMQKALIRYLRSALPQMRQGSSTLGRELRLSRSYLELIKMRIEERLEVDLAVPEGLESAEFPPMMLQSLVENAIKHGIEPKPEGGLVRVTAGVQNGQLWVEVADTGIGLPDGGLDERLPTSGTGLGLQNICDRLAMLYPGKSRLTLRSDAGTGTTARISLPYRHGEETARPDITPMPARSAA